MGLPRELIDEIMRYNDFQTLKECSLTSRAFYSAARPLIHSRMTLGIRSARRGSEVSPEIPFSTGAFWQQADMFHARYLSAAEERGLLRYGYIREVTLQLSQLAHPENVLRLQQLRAFETVRTLTIDRLELPRILPIFESCFSQFVPTLRSLGLRDPRCEDIHQLMEFICRFPHLDDLTFTESYGPPLADAPLGSKPPRPQRPIPFGGHLYLDGMVDNLIRCLVDFPGGIRFRSIEVRSGDGFGELLMACSSTLEVLTFHCIEIRESGTRVPHI